MDPIDAVRKACTTVNAKKARGWFAHSGYRYATDIQKETKYFIDNF